MSMIVLSPRAGEHHSKILINVHAKRVASGLINDKDLARG